MIRLRDGRRLCFDEVGCSDGTPILYFHGNGHSRLGRHPDDEIAERLGVRLITIDRPGIGRSTYQPGRRVVDWSADVRELADALDIGTFGILASSSGGPYAAACAHALPHRVKHVAVVSGLAPFDQPGTTDGMELETRFLLRLARRSAWAVVPPIALIRWTLAVSPRLVMSVLFAKAPPSDLAVLKRPDIRGMLIASYREAVHRGVRGMAQEGSLNARPWGFRVEEVQPSVALYHGDADNVAPVGMGRYMSTHLPHASLRVFPGEGHQLIWQHWEEIVGDLAATVREA